MKWALYDLTYNPPSFDVFTFIQYVKHLKLEGVWFKPGYNENHWYGGRAGERERMRTIVLPALKLYGLPHEISNNHPQLEWPIGAKQRHIHRFNGILDVLEPAVPIIPQESLDRANDRFKGKRPILVIIRNSRWMQERNSSGDWTKWASDHEAAIIKDSYDEPISLEDRIACYELSSVCMGPMSGNFHPNLVSKRPYISICWGRDRYGAKKHGIREGFRFPWQTEKQHLVWSMGDSYKEICKAYEEWEKT